MKHWVLTVLASVAWASAAAAPEDVVVPAPGTSYWVAIEQGLPDYPRHSGGRNVNGCVAVSFVVEADGRPASIKVLASYPEDYFDRHAIRSLKRWRFEPGPDNPDRMPALLTQVFDFEIEDSINEPVSCVRSQS